MYEWLVLLALALAGGIAWELHCAPTINEGNCPFGERDCGGPCDENPPCVEE